MNIEAYDLDSLRKIIRGLQEENKSLKAQLRQEEYTDLLLQGSMRRFSSKCSGVVRTFMQNVGVRADIFHNAQTDGIITSALSSMAKSSFAMSVHSING